MAAAPEFPPLLHVAVKGDYSNLTGVYARHDGITRFEAPTYLQLPNGAQLERRRHEANGAERVRWMLTLSGKYVAVDGSHEPAATPQVVTEWVHVDTCDHFDTAVEVPAQGAINASLLTQLRARTEELRRKYQLCEMRLCADAQGGEEHGADEAEEAEEGGESGGEEDEEDGADEAAEAEEGEENWGEEDEEDGADEAAEAEEGEENWGEEDEEDGADEAAEAERSEAQSTATVRSSELLQRDDEEEEGEDEESTEDEARSAGEDQEEGQEESDTEKGEEGEEDGERSDEEAEPEVGAVRGGRALRGLAELQKRKDEVEAECKKKLEEVEEQCRKRREETEQRCMERERLAEEQRQQRARDEERERSRRMRNEEQRILRPREDEEQRGQRLKGAADEAEQRKRIREVKQEPAQGEQNAQGAAPAAAEDQGAPPQSFGGRVLSAVKRRRTGA